MKRNKIITAAILIVLALSPILLMGAFTYPAANIKWGSINATKEGGTLDLWLDEAEDRLDGTGSISNKLIIGQISAPSGDPTSNTAWLYVKDNGGTATLYWEDEAGSVTAVGAGTYTGGNITSDMTLNADGVDMQGTTTTAHTFALKGYDVDNTTYRDVLRWTNGDTLATVIGSSLGSLAISSTGLNVTTGGVITGAGGITNTGVLTSAGGATNLNTSGSDAVNIGTGTYTGTATVGNNSASVAIASSVWDISGAGAMSGFTTLGLSGDITMATGKGVLSSTTTAETVGVYGYDNNGAARVAGLLVTNGDTPATVLGNVNGTTAISSSDWAISTAGAMTGIGAITADGLITGSAGATINGAALNLEVSSNFAVNISTGTTNAQVTIGGGSAPLAIDSTAFDVTNAGAVSGVTTLSMSDDLSLANGKAIKGSTTTGQTIKMQAYDNDTGPAYVDALTITNGNTPGISFGNNATTVAVNSTDWDIDATGAMTGIGAITADGLLTASAGATITGAAVSLNASSNFAVNIGTGTTTTQVTIGGGSNRVDVASDTWDMTNGAATGVVSITGTGAGAVSGFLKTVTADTDNEILTVAGSGKVYTNAAAGGAQTFTLPAAAAGLEFTFIVMAAQELRVDPTGDDVVYINAVGADAAEYWTANAVGESVHLIAVDATNWVAISHIGTWTQENP